MKCNECGFKFSMDYNRYQELEDGYFFGTVFCPLCKQPVKKVPCGCEVLSDNVTMVHME